MSFRRIFGMGSTVSCEQCGSTIWDHEPRVQDGDNIFCGHECKEEYWEDNSPTVLIFQEELPLEFEGQQLRFKGL